jgi:hypothetical protein
MTWLRRWYWRHRSEKALRRRITRQELKWSGKHLSDEELDELVRGIRREPWMSEEKCPPGWCCRCADYDNQCCKCGAIFPEEE